MQARSTGLNVDQDDEALLRKFTFAEEDRRLYTTAAWKGEYRWFRSSNVIPLEKYRKRAERAHARPQRR